MNIRPTTPPAWRDGAFLTLGEAAKIAERSYSWARDRMIEGRLERRTIGRGPIVVTTASLARLLDDRPFSTMRAHTERKNPRHLRLVVDNSSGEHRS